YRIALYAAFHCWCHSWRRRVCGGPYLANRCGCRRADIDARRLFPVLHANIARLANRCARRNSDCRIGAASLPQSPRKTGETVMNTLSVLSQRPWIWSYIATIAVWLITISFTGSAGIHGLSHAAFTFAAFSVIVGLGQMFVITLGPGNIDLSVPATMTLAATIALKLMDTQNDMILAGLAVAILIGLAVGICNFALIKLLRIPPIIATLSLSFLVQ